MKTSRSGYADAAPKTCSSENVRSANEFAQPRRRFLKQSLGAAAAAIVGDCVCEGSAQTQLRAPDGFANSQPSGHLEPKKRIAKPPFRVGFHRILDPSIGKETAWYINDHCFIQDRAGHWHVFGITAPEPAQPLNERFLLHATASKLYGPWTEQDPVMHSDQRLGETVVWAPYVIEHDGRYWMFYCAGGESHERYRIHLATSPDLSTWSRHAANPMVIDGFDARDPMVLRVGKEWVLYYCATSTPEGGNHVVAAVTSPDLIHWSERRIVFSSPVDGRSGGPTESPFVVQRGGKYYLFVCTNNPYNNTAVYVSKSPFSWSPDDMVLTYGAHASEVIRVPDDRWFTSSAGWGQGGLYLAELDWD